MESTEEKNILTTDEYTGYNHLYNMCKNIRNERASFKGYLSPITDRLNYIIQSLSTHGINFRVASFEHYNKNHFNGNDLKLANVMVDFKVNESDETIIFTAHHDIANHNSENCQDNTASVCNLIDLCVHLKRAYENGELTKNVTVGFTDCEEVGGRGMNHLIQEIEGGLYGEKENVTIYALELTACGNNFWVSGITKDSDFYNEIKELTKKEEVFAVNTPYNESVNARRYGIKACCIGILDDENIEQVKGRGYCETWGLCHSLEDTFEESADEVSMNNFVQDLLKLAYIKK
jgi:hypothetical protein